MTQQQKQDVDQHTVTVRLNDGTMLTFYAWKRKAWPKKELVR